jgi:hypothetical protein
VARGVPRSSRVRMRPSGARVRGMGAGRRRSPRGGPGRSRPGHRLGARAPSPAPIVPDPPGAVHGVACPRGVCTDPGRPVPGLRPANGGRRCGGFLEAPGPRGGGVPAARCRGAVRPPGPGPPCGGLFVGTRSAGSGEGRRWEDVAPAAPGGGQGLGPGERGCRACPSPGSPGLLDAASLRAVHGRAGADARPCAGADGGRRPGPADGRTADRRRPDRSRGLRQSREIPDGSGRVAAGRRVAGRAGARRSTPRDNGHAAVPPSVRVSHPCARASWGARSRGGTGP